MGDFFSRKARFCCSNSIELVLVEGLENKFENSSCKNPPASALRVNDACYQSEKAWGLGNHEYYKATNVVVFVAWSFINDKMAIVPNNFHSR